MIDTPYLDFIKIAIAFVLGALLGVERQYRNKPAGFRTLIMITVGATLFTILSNRVTANPDRIAANIITGIGFIGAGVIFKDGLKVSGMTTAATIWIAASVGMAVGYGAFYLAATVTLVMLATLVLLEKPEDIFLRFHQVKFYKITFTTGECSFEELEKNFSQLNIQHKKDNESKVDNQVIVFYQLTARKIEFDLLNDYLMKNKFITGFDMGM
jgi:putative Mg2+ transporter-C (MgtC) family protein